MNIIFTVINLIALGLLSFIGYRRSFLLQKIYWPSLLIKLAAGIVLGLLYTYYYTIADTFDFFEDGKKIAALVNGSVSDYINFLWRGGEAEALQLTLTFTEPRALYMAKMVSLFCLITHNNYWLISLYFSVVSFLCAWRLAHLITQYFPTAKIAAVIAFLLTPSVVFWGAGLMKESISMAALFFLSAVILKIWMRQKINWLEILLSFFALWILWQLKYYYAAVLLPVTATCMLVKFAITPIFRIRSAAAEIIAWCVIVVLPFVIIPFAKENFQPDTFFKVIVKNYHEFHNHSAPGDAIVFKDLQPTASSVVSHSPWALCSGLFRPFLWEAQNVLQLLVSIENVILLVLLITSSKNIKLILTSTHRSLLLSILTYVVLLCIFLTLSTPNFGTLSRYRIGFLPYLVLLASIHNSLVTSVYNSLERLYHRIVR